MTSAQPGTVFFLFVCLFLSTDSILYFPAQVHFFLFLFFFFICCTLNGIFIILIYLFKLIVFIEILTTVFKIIVLHLFLYSYLNEMVFIYETEK